MPIAVVAIGGDAPGGARGGGARREEGRAPPPPALPWGGIAAVLAAGYQVVLTHGNGPQVGDAWLRSELAAAQVEPLPLDVCGAETQGSIGYLLQQVLHDTLQRRGLARPVVTMVTQVLVSGRDPPPPPPPPSRWGRSTPARRRSGGRRRSAGRWSRTQSAAGGAWCPRRSPRSFSSSKPSKGRSRAARS